MELADFYKNILKLDNIELINEAVKLSELKTIKRGEYLIRQGEVPSQIYFLMSGILRGFMFGVNGKEITDCIVFRCGNVAMPDSDFTQPASITMEAVEDSKVVCISIPEIYRLLKKYPFLSELYQSFLLYSANLHRNLKIATYQYSAVQRYQWFLKEYPGLIDRISHKYIASLLNMTPVTLSNIRRIIRKETEVMQ